jgi:hypothetical protein
MLLQVAVALFATYMLTRHLPLLLRALRRPPAGEARRPGRAIVPTLNVLLALALLTMAMTRLVGPLTTR